MSRRLLVTFDLGTISAVVSGPGARDLIIRVTRRPPVWLPLRKAWAVQRKTARDVIAVAEASGYEVLIREVA